jgi:hypothetical protein
MLAFRLGSAARHSRWFAERRESEFHCFAGHHEAFRDVSILVARSLRCGVTAFGVPDVEKFPRTDVFLADKDGK